MIDAMKHIKIQHLAIQENSKEEAIARLLSGKATWNAWAIALGAEKQALIDEGNWEAERVWSTEHNAIITQGENAATKDWLVRSMVDFSHLTFTSTTIEYLGQAAKKSQNLNHENTTTVTFEGEDIDVSGFIFPSDALFHNCHFKARANFKDVLIEGDAWFEETKFDRASNFSKANFEGEAWFNRTSFTGDARFKAAHFAQGTWFNQSRFAKKAQFSEITCCKSAWFHDTLFKGRASFNQSKFSGDSAFEEATFKGRALFKETKFEKEASFKECNFASRALFKHALFSGGAHFNNCDFNGYTIFHNSVFKSGANFKAIQAQRGFNLEGTVFETEIPNFSQAHLKEPAELTDITLMPPPKCSKFSPRVKAVLSNIRPDNRLMRRLALVDTLTTEWLAKRYQYYENRFINARRKPSDAGYYLSLKRLADDAANIAAQKQFHAGVVRSRRHLKDTMSSLPSGGFNYLTGVVDELTSNFGRSLIRPLFWWSAVFLMFTSVYLAQAINPLTGQCQNQKALTPLGAAQIISINNAFGLGWVGKKNVERSHSCLYGHHQTLKEKKDQSRLATLSGQEKQLSQKPMPKQAKTPLSTKLTGLLHVGLSFFFISLFFISLRNRLQM